MSLSGSSSSSPILPRLHWGWVVVFIICVWFFWSTADILPPFLAGLVIAYLLDPVADRMEERGVPRWAATSLALIIFFSLIAGAVVLMAPLVTAQATALINALPNLIESLTPMVQHWYDELTLVIELDDIGRQLMERAASVGGTIAKSVISQSLALFNILALLIIVPVVSFYSLRDFDHMTARIWSLIPPRYKTTSEGLWREADKALGGFIRGQSLVCAVLAVFYATGWWLTGLDYALILGLIAGLLAFVPYLGAFISVALALLVGLGQFGFDALHLILIFAVFQVGQILEGSVLTPNLIGNRIGLHPLWVLFAVFAGGEIAGLWGVFLAVPVAAVVAVFVRAVLRQYMSSALYGPAAAAK